MTAFSFRHYSTNPGPNRRQTRVLRWRHALGTVVALLIAACFGPQTPTAAASSGLSSTVAHATVANVVSRNWLEDLLQDLEDVEEALEGASAAAAVIDQTGSSTAQTQLAGLLDAAIVSIDNAMQHGFFDGADLNTVDPTVAPETLLEYAADTHGLAIDAETQVLLAPNPDPQAVAEQLNTIRQLINRVLPHSYRSTAGL